MTNREAAMTRWLAQIYANRGQVDHEHWLQFEQFIGDHGLWVEPTPGRRRDGTDTWDAFEVQLRQWAFDEFEASPNRVQLRGAWDGKKYREITAIHRGDLPRCMVDQKT